MSVRILQFGTTGQLARELIRQSPQYPDLEITTLSRADCDFADPEKAARIVFAAGADLVIIAAAYTAVDHAETDAELCYEVNAETPAAIAMMCGGDGQPALVHFSTDYVFDGEKGSPYVETDEPEPLNVYGKMKLSGERMVLAGCARTLLLRTSWVVSSHGKNFVKTMLRLGREGAPLKVVDDQFGKPTSAADLAGFVLSQAEALAKAPDGDPRFGLFHFANAGEISWKTFAEGVFAEAFGEAAPKVEAISAADRPAPARRPRRGTLDTSKLERTFDYQPRPWRAALADIVADLKTEQPA